MARVFGWKAEDIRQTIEDAVAEYGLKVNDLLESPTREWTEANQPEFIVHSEVVNGDLIVTAGPSPSDPATVVYTWVTRGTKKHDISVKKAKNLTFWHYYQPSTTPGSLASKKPGNTKSFKRVPPKVTHPGAEAREFEKTAAEEAGPGLAPHVQSLMTIIFRRPPYQRP